MSYRILKEMMNGNFSFDTTQKEPNPAANIFSQQTQDQPDTVTMDVPTFIRILEWANEDCEDDVMLHQVANELIIANFRHTPLTMQDYIDVIEPKGPNKEDTEVMF